MTFNSGFAGTATVDGTELPITAWSVDPSIRNATTENSLSGGFVLTATSGGKQARFTISIDYDFDSSPFASPLGIVIGATLANVKLYLQDTGGDYWNFPVAIVTGTPQSIQHTGTSMVSVSVSCVSNGTFAYPGSITP